MFEDSSMERIELAEAMKSILLEGNEFEIKFVYDFYNKLSKDLQKDFIICLQIADESSRCANWTY